MKTEQMKLKNINLKMGEYKCFKNINKSDWEYSIGGYQPLQKWLKDRKGIRLLSKDIEWYERIIFGIRESISLMDEIDLIIEL